MKALLLACVILLASAAPTFAGACLISLTRHEERAGSFHKICWYKCGIDEVPLTISSTRPCPLKVDAPDARGGHPER